MKTIRNTHQKEVILETLKEMNNHPTATMLCEQLAKVHPGIGRSTVFRVLKQLAEQGEILKVSISAPQERYDFNTQPHYHIRCLCCGRVDDVQMEVQTELVDAVSDAGGYEITGHAVEFYGLCLACRNKTGKGGNRYGVL